MLSSNPEGVAGRAPAAWRLSRTTCRSSPPRGAGARWRGRAKRESLSGSEVLSQMQMGRGAEGLRRVQRGRAAAGPRERRDQTPGGGTAETRRRRCHSCREWMRERSGGILLRDRGGGERRKPYLTRPSCRKLKPGAARHPRSRHLPASPAKRGKLQTYQAPGSISDATASLLSEDPVSSSSLGTKRERC